MVIDRILRLFIFYIVLLVYIYIYIDRLLIILSFIINQNDTHNLIRNLFITVEHNES
jgi:hypothetical protein